MNTVARSRLRIVETAWRLTLDVALPFDRARSAMLALCAPAISPLFADRGLRVLVTACVSLTFAFVMAMIEPAWLLAFGPIFLGVPHLLADARYLVARPLLHRRAAFWIAIALPAAVVWANPHAWVGLFAALGATLVARASIARRLVLAIAITACGVFAYTHERACDVVLAHAHNFVAVAIWTLFFRRASDAGGISNARHFVVIALFIVGSVALFFLPQSLLSLNWATDISGVSVAEQTSYLSPIDSNTWAPRFVVFFAFAQTVHYAVWLRVLPEEDRPRAGVRGFASSARALRADLGIYVLGALALLALAIIFWSAFDLHAARIGYLRVAITHGALELGVAALFFLERKTALRV